MGMDGIHAELLQHGNVKLLQQLHSLFGKIWVSDSVHEDWRDTVMGVLYKGKSNRNDCGNCREISLLSVVGKVLCRVFLDRLLNETRCRFRKSIWFSCGARHY